MQGPMAAKFEPLTHGTLNEAQLAVAGQILAVVMLLTGGFVSTWMFGREWADRTIGSLFANAVTRRAIGWAKVTIIVGWALVCVSAAVALTTAAGAIIAPHGFTAAVRQQAYVVWGASAIMALLGLPFACVAVVTRGYLGAIGVLIGTTAISQILAAVGVGRWTPYVAPPMWAGAGGPEQALLVGPIHLIWAMAFAAIGTYAAVRAFAHARLD